tara:strand:- start:1607 stop:1726 length:120 start_codon:yes stop_codon:yes gene_type:complete
MIAIIPNKVTPPRIPITADIEDLIKAAMISITNSIAAFY